MADPRNLTDAELTDMSDEYLVQRLFDIANAAGVWHGMGLHQFEQGQQADSLENYEKGRGLVADASPYRAELLRRLSLAAARPAGDETVTISQDTANWASVAFAHAPWSDDPEVREHVRRASQELGIAIDSALAAAPEPSETGGE